MLSAILGAWACRPQEAVPTPSEGPTSGYFPIDLDLSGTRLEAESVRAVTVGGTLAYDVTPTSSGLRFIVQGAPEGGPADITVDTGDGPRSMGTFDYLAPEDERFARVVAIGASYTQGVQDGVPTLDGSLWSPSFQVARALGAYHALPLLTEGLFPTEEIEDLSAPPACDPPDIVSHMGSAIVDVISALTAEGTDGAVDYRLGRVDPDLEPFNLGVGGLGLADLLDGPEPGDLATNFVGALVLAPETPGFGDVGVAPLDRLEELEPTLVLALEPWGNDVLLPARQVDAAALPDFALLEAQAEDFLARLADTGAQVFVATLPRPSLLPGVQAGRQHTIEAWLQSGLSEAEATARVDQELQAVDAAVVDFNQTWTGLAGRHAQIHVVDLSGAAEEWSQGVSVDGERLSLGALDGLVSLDGVHLGRTGYALVANLFLDAIDLELGTTSSRVDVDAVHRSDPSSPEQLLARGLDPQCLHEAAD